MGGGPPDFLQGFSCLAVLRIQLSQSCFRVRGFHSLWPDFPIRSVSLSKSFPRSEPRDARISVWALPVPLAATPGIILIFSYSGYLDVSVHRVPGHNLWIQLWSHEGCSCRFPHSDIHGSRIICISPWLFAAYHVFLRLLVPRHPPCALISLTFLVSLDFISV